MANDTDSVGFFAGRGFANTPPQRQPQKTAIIAKEEELTFAALNRRVHALAGHLQQKAFVKAIVSVCSCPTQRRFPSATLLHKRSAR